MISRRVILMCSLALAWCWAAWHEDLEAAGWMFEHTHHSSDHVTDQTGSPGHVPFTKDDHHPVWARGMMQDARVLLLFQLIFMAVALTGFWLAAFSLQVRPAQSIALSRHHPRNFDPIWHFVRRCAPDGAAPPVLG